MGCAGEAKQLCFHSTFNTTDMKNEVDGLCGSYETCLCFTSQCQLPPMKGSPKCALFGKEFAPAKDEVSKSDEVLKDYAGMMTDSWFCIYCLCGGMGCSKIKGNDRPFIGAVDKCLCCRGSLDFDLKGYGIEEDGTMCAYSGTELCFWGQCQFPISRSSIAALASRRRSLTTLRISKGYCFQANSVADIVKVRTFPRHIVVRTSSLPPSFVVYNGCEAATLLWE